MASAVGDNGWKRTPDGKFRISAGALLDALHGHSAPDTHAALQRYASTADNGMYMAEGPLHDLLERKQQSRLEHKPEDRQNPFVEAPLPGEKKPPAWANRVPGTERGSRWNPFKPGR